MKCLDETVSGWCVQAAAESKVALLPEAGNDWQ